MEQQFENNYQPLKVSDWVLTIFLTAIPLVGLILLFVWAFSSETHPSKANWAKATLIWYAIGIILTTLFFRIFVTAAFLSSGY